MNNEQFRKLMLASSAKSERGNAVQASAEKTSNAGVALGSRQRTSAPMKPRSVATSHTAFSKQSTTRGQTQQSKSFRTAAPKGSKLADGYTDRSKLRNDEADDRTERLQELEEALKNEEIDQATFERLRFEIAGGDLESTHLVKGLDFKLLERIRQGEDVYSGKPEEEDASVAPTTDVDVEFDQLEEQEVRAVEREKADKKGQLSTAPLTQGKKRTRDQILAELKAAREAAKASAEPALSNRFKKIGGKVAAGTRFERDGKGREVMIITDEDGHEKRKVRRLQPGEETAPDLVADPTIEPLGMEIPEQYRTKQAQLEDDDSDIFADAGDDYDPLAGLDGSDSDSDNEKEDKGDAADKTTKAASATATATAASKQNYFQGSKTGLMSEEKQDQPSISDPAIMAAIKRAAALRHIPGDAGSDSDSDSEANAQKAERKAREERHRKMLANNDRDAEDMDMGFGTSRFEDEEEFEDSKTKLSNWGDTDMAGDNGDDNGPGKSKRKRAPKKRKGDVNNADDVLRVMEARKKA